jgi:hypothetical protein
LHTEARNLENRQDVEQREKLMKMEGEHVVAEAKKRNVHLRLLGAVAFQLHCPKFGNLTTKLSRVLSDIDFAGYSKERTSIEKMMRELGYADQRGMATTLFGHRRMIWDNKSNGMHVDIFLDKLEMNHDVPFTDRLELEELTIPLADMLLEKMQIVNLNEKDIVDTIMLLREHSVGDAAPETIDAGYIAKLLSTDWGFYYTVTMNLKKIQDRLVAYDQLQEEDRADISGKIQGLLRMIELEPKTTSWALKARLGTRRKWYRDVEDINR